MPVFKLSSPEPRGRRRRRSHDDGRDWNPPESSDRRPRPGVDNRANTIAKPAARHPAPLGLIFIGLILVGMVLFGYGVENLPDPNRYISASRQPGVMAVVFGALLFLTGLAGSARGLLSRWKDVRMQRAIDGDALFVGEEHGPLGLPPADVSFLQGHTVQLLMCGLVFAGSVLAVPIIWMSRTTADMNAVFSIPFAMLIAVGAAVGALLLPIRWWVSHRALRVDDDEVNRGLDDVEEERFVFHGEAEVVDMKEESFDRPARAEQHVDAGL